MIIEDNEKIRNEAEDKHKTVLNIRRSCVFSAEKKSTAIIPVAFSEIKIDSNVTNVLNKFSSPYSEGGIKLANTNNSKKPIPLFKKEKKANSVPFLNNVLVRILFIKAKDMLLSFIHYSFQIHPISKGI